MMNSISAFRSGLIRLSAAKRLPSFNICSIRQSHSAMHGTDKWYGAYRADLPPTTYGIEVKMMKVMQVFLWFWVFYSFWYEPGAALGHPQFFKPDPSKWTDEELGIPPDDYDEEV